MGQRSPRETSRIKSLICRIRLGDFAGRKTAKNGEITAFRPVESPEFDPNSISSILAWIDIERIVEGDPDRKNARRNALIFKLHYIDGFEAGEIAKFPGFELSKSGVETILARLRKRTQK